MIALGVFFLVLACYGAFATYRTLKYKELYWGYLNVWYRRDKGYSKTVCNVVGILSIPVDLLLFYVSFILLFPK